MKTQRGFRRSFEMLALSAVLLGASLAHADEIGPSLSQGWRLFEAPELRFRIRLPAEPVRSEDVRSTWVGKVKELELRAEAAGAEFIVQVRDLPRATRWLVTQSYIFSQVKDGLLRDGERPELSDEPITRGGYPGRHIRYEDPERVDGDGNRDWVEDALVFLGNDRLYFVVVARSRAAEAGLPIEAFFASFELW